MMIFRDRENHLVLPNCFKCQAGVDSFEADIPYLHLAIDHIFDHSRRVADPQDRSYFRIFLDERAELLRQQVFPGDIAATDPEFAAERAMKLLHGGQCLSLKRKKTARFDRDHLAQRSQTNLTRSSVK